MNKRIIEKEMRKTGEKQNKEMKKILMKLAVMDKLIKKKRTFLFKHKSSISTIPSNIFSFYSGTI